MAVASASVRAALFQRWLSELAQIRTAIEDAYEDELETSPPSPPSLVAVPWLRRMVFRTEWHFMRPRQLVPITTRARLPQALFDEVWRCVAAVCLLSGVADSQLERTARTNAETLLGEALAKYGDATTERRLEEMLRDLVYKKYTVPIVEQRRSVYYTPKHGKQLDAADWTDVCATFIYLAEFILGPTPGGGALAAPVPEAWNFRTQQQQQQAAAALQPPPPSAVPVGGGVRRRIRPTLLLAAPGRRSAPPPSLQPTATLDDDDGVERLRQALSAARAEAEQQREQSFAAVVDRQGDVGAVGGRRWRRRRARSLRLALLRGGDLAASNIEQRVHDEIDSLRRRLPELLALPSRVDQVRASFATSAESRRRHFERYERFVNQFRDDLRRLAHTAAVVLRADATRVELYRTASEAVLEMAAACHVRGETVDSIAVNRDAWSPIDGGDAWQLALEHGAPLSAPNAIVLPGGQRRGGAEDDDGC